MLEKKFFQKLKNKYVRFSKERREVIGRSNEALNVSKRAIFALHRDDLKQAEGYLKQAETIFADLKKLASKNEALKKEGSYHAALEEYAEARLFYNFAAHGTVGSIKETEVDFDAFLGGLCDFTGELVRRAVNRATYGKYDEVEKIKKIVDAVMTELIECDLTGYLRQKYDQAKNNMRKMEDIRYDIQMKK